MGYVQEARENHVKKKVEEALRSKMKQKALKECDEYAAKYAECAIGKTLSVVWKCRKQAKELNNCLHQFTNDAVLEKMKKEYTLQEEAKGPMRVHINELIQWKNRIMEFNHQEPGEYAHLVQPYKLAH
ncbi:unnamed protein product [Cuscuta europaea]|uniref:COX assembly mitochondrial protein n=1 Tax=Cuscuta europaea TaxID=41803 RepID=A0A9P0YLF9_CUSEU|nr:unnamed protein product [Cuscuta europaea]